MLPILRTLRTKNISNATVKYLMRAVPKRYYVGTPITRKSHNKVYYLYLQNIKQQKYNFHTTQKLHIPPIIALLLRPVLRFGSFIVGRRLRRWWMNKSDKEKENFSYWLKTNRNVLLGSISFLCLLSIIYCIMHLEVDPITRRRRLILFNEAQQKAFGNLLLQAHLDEHKSHLVNPNHPSYKRLSQITKKLLSGNKDLISFQNAEWSLTVVDLPMKNAYVLPGGNIFVFLGVFDITENDEQLGIILAHEVAHNLLLHWVEQLSDRVILDILLTIPMLLLWIIFPDIIAGLLQMIGQRIVNLIYHLPYNRALEAEADDVGLKLAAKACIDVREAVVFWGMMRVFSEMGSESTPVPWLSTHPAHGDREQTLNEKLPKAIELMKLSGCPQLSPIDPRKEFYSRTKKEYEQYFKKKGVM